MKLKTVLYFQPANFSPRFANETIQPLTCEVCGFSLSQPSQEDGTCLQVCPGVWGRPHVVYHLIVKMGREKWLLERRFSEFEAFRAIIVSTYKSIDVDPLPPKTCMFSPLDDADGFLSGRQKGLVEWLDLLLISLNRFGLVSSPIVSDFLDIYHINKRE